MTQKVVGTGAAEGAPRVGVVGGGQLARMMQEAAVALGIELRVLVEAADGASGQVVPQSMVGSADDLAAITELARGVDVLTVEHEHVPDAVLEEVAGIVPVRPGAAALAYAQDKLLMREKMDAIGIACPRWFRVDDDAALAAGLAELGGMGILKTPRDGYDGKGVLVVSLVDEVCEPAATVAQWFAAAEGPLLLEEKVPYTVELAQVVARRPSGEVRSWCATQTIQEEGICARTISPAPVSPEVRSRARRMGERIASELDVSGILAVEMFVAPGEDGSERVLVNELAMRPHNSGHWTIEGAVTSQFENHLRAVLDLPLGDTAERAPWTVMVNLLGSELGDPREAYARVMGEFPDAKIHMYGKEVKPRRKIGHITIFGEDLSDVLSRAQAATAILRGDERN